MSYRSGVVTGVVAAAVVAGAIGGGLWLSGAKLADNAKAAAPSVPATVAKPAKEDQFNTVVLTADAEARLGVKVAPIERKPTKRVRVYGGEVTVPPGGSIVVSAPVTGTLKTPSGGVPKPGQAVAAGRAVFQLLPMLTPDAQANLSAARVDADGQANSAKATLELAKISLDRNRNLLKNEAGSQRLVDEAQGAFEIAEKTLAAANARRELLARVLGDVEKGTANPVPVECPAEGLLRTLSAAPGQTVPAGAPLFEVVDTSTVWVRVPVYVGDLADLDLTGPVAVGTLSMRPGDATRVGKPVPAPPAANALAGTADLFYELDNKAGSDRPGQRVGVSVPLAGAAEGLCVPWAAVLHDITGGTWVYERTAPLTYARRRVTVRNVVGDSAVLAAGPAAGTQVVTAGAAELFGTETGFSK